MNIPGVFMNIKNVERGVPSIGTSIGTHGTDNIVPNIGTSIGTHGTHNMMRDEDPIPDCMICGANEDIHLIEEIDGYVCDNCSACIGEHYLETCAKCIVCTETFLEEPKNWWPNCKHSWCEKCHAKLGPQANVYPCCPLCNMEAKFGLEFFKY